jgi:hypothetical protein
MVERSYDGFTHLPQSCLSLPIRLQNVSCVSSQYVASAPGSTNFSCLSVCRDMFAKELFDGIVYIAV